MKKLFYRSSIFLTCHLCFIRIFINDGNKCPRYNFCRGSVKEIKQRSHDFIDIWVKPYLRVVEPEWEHMLRCFAEGASYLGPSCTFKMLLMFVTDLLNIDMPRTRRTLTYFEWFFLMSLR